MNVSVTVTDHRGANIEDCRTYLWRKHGNDLSMFVTSLETRTLIQNYANCLKYQISSWNQEFLTNEIRDKNRATNMKKQLSFVENKSVLL